jgi:hypothetical protein
MGALCEKVDPAVAALATAAVVVWYNSNSSSKRLLLARNIMTEF